MRSSGNVHPTHREQYPHRYGSADYARTNPEFTDGHNYDDESQGSLGRERDYRPAEATGTFETSSFKRTSAKSGARANTGI